MAGNAIPAKPAAGGRDRCFAPLQHSSIGLVIGLLLVATARAQVLELASRPANAPGGVEFAAQIAPLGLLERERAIDEQVAAGNVPAFLRRLCPVVVTNVFSNQTNSATFFVTPEYLAIGSDSDYLLMPVSPNTGQKIADDLHCSLPTRKMVDAIYAAAAVKLTPAPIAPSPAMTTVEVFSNHNAIVRAQRAEHLAAHPFGALVAGHQKDVVVSAGLATAPGKVAIYGWHRTDGRPIQPLYLGHTAAWVDYSQCTRLVQERMLVNGQSTTVRAVLADPVLSGLLSDEGPIANPRYPTNALAAVPASTVPTNATPEPAGALLPQPPGLTNSLGERIRAFVFEPEVKVLLNEPANEGTASHDKLLLVFYALPNGNTTAQTIGRTLQPGDDWHYDIQHIGAQTRFLRAMLSDRTVVVAYLENNLKSWPAWRKKHGDRLIPQLLKAVGDLFPQQPIDTVLCGHSGGGSLIFGYLNTVAKIPDRIVRIAFLDSNYAYDSALGHQDKLAAWLKEENHYLCVLAYNDAVALLDGKPFVSAPGGTWGKSHEMEHDLAGEFQFSSSTNAEFQRFRALDGRVQFILKENPERKIFHTVQVERNGFIHALVSGTTNESRGYEYFGPRAYTNWILSP